MKKEGKEGKREEQSEKHTVEEEMTSRKERNRWEKNPAKSPYLTHLGHSAETAMAPHSSALAWRIPWTEEPGGLQSLGSRRVGHD